jgi:hypothetical protein
VRNLPPKLTEAEFRESIKRWDEQINWLSFEPGALEHAGLPGQRKLGFAHLRFVSQDAVVEFSKVVDGAPYRDSSGAETRLTVELAVRTAAAPHRAPAPT